MKIVDLAPRTEPKHRPRCEGIRTEKYANDTWSTDKQCCRMSRYQIDGKHLCTVHAGKHALQSMIDKQKQEEEQRRADYRAEQEFFWQG